MIRRPNVRARCFVPNVQARYPGNRKFLQTPYKMHCRRCLWCKRPRVGGHWAYPGLCTWCTDYLLMLETPDLYELLETRDEHLLHNSGLLRTGFGRYRTERPS